MHHAVQRQVETSPSVDRSGPRTETRQAVSLDEAANQTGLTLDALRKRLQRGQMDGYKANDGRWRVYVSALDNSLDNDRSGPVSPNNDRSRLSNVEDNTRQVYQDLLNAVRVRIADKSGVIEYLKAQIEAKDSQLAAKDDQLAHKDKMLAQLIAKLPAVDGGRVEGLEKRNQVLEIENKRNKLMLKKVYAIIRANQKSATRDSG